MATLVAPLTSRTAVTGLPASRLVVFCTTTVGRTQRRAGAGAADREVTLGDDHLLRIGAGADVDRVAGTGGITANWIVR